MRKLIVAGLFGSMAICAPAWAAQGEICKSEGIGLSGGRPAVYELTNGLLFKCEAAGEKTIPQLYAAGWRVVQYMPMTGMRGGNDPMLPPQQVMNHVILIEKI